MECVARMEVHTCRCCHKQYDCAIETARKRLMLNQCWDTRPWPRWIVFFTPLLKSSEKPELSSALCSSMPVYKDTRAAEWFPEQHPWKRISVNRFHAQIHTCYMPHHPVSLRVKPCLLSQFRLIYPGSTFAGWCRAVRSETCSKHCLLSLPASSSVWERQDLLCP